MEKHLFIPTSSKVHLVGVKVTEQFIYLFSLLTYIIFAGKEGTYKTNDKGNCFGNCVHPVPFYFIGRDIGCTDK